MRRAVLDVAEDLEDVDLALGPALVLVDVGEHVLDLGQRRLERRGVGVVAARAARVLKTEC